MSRELAVIVALVLAIVPWSSVCGQVELLQREGKNVEGAVTQDAEERGKQQTEGQQGSQTLVYYVFTVTDDDVIYEIAKNKRNWNVFALSTKSTTGKSYALKYKSPNGTNQIYHTIRNDMDATNATHLVVVEISSDFEISQVIEKGWLPKDENMHKAPIEPGHIEYKNGKAVPCGTKVVLNKMPEFIAKSNPDVKIAGFCLMSHGKATCALLAGQNFSAESVATDESVTNDLYDGYTGDGLVARPEILDRFVPGAIITFCGCNTGVEYKNSKKSLAHRLAIMLKAKSVKVRGRIESGAVHNHYSHGMTYQYVEDKNGEGYKLEKGHGLSKLTKGKFGDNEIVVDGQVLQRVN